MIQHHEGVRGTAVSLEEGMNWIGGFRESVESTTIAPAGVRYDDDMMAHDAESALKHQHEWLENWSTREDSLP